MWHSVASLLLMSLTLAASSVFYLFGIEAGDIFNNASDDGSSSIIYLKSAFTFFGNTYSQIYVNNNGFLTFDQPSPAFNPIIFLPNQSIGRDIIAPFWTDIDNRGNGNISYHQYTNGSVLTQATQDINQYFPEQNFTASWVFVATWDKVAYYPNSGTQTSFQVVLISDGNLSFVLMNYGAIAPTNYRPEAGYYKNNSTQYYVILWSDNGKNVSDLMYSSNVNVPGRWAFMVNTNPRVSANKDSTIALRVNVTADHDLTMNNTQQIISLLQHTLINNGLPNTINLTLISIEKIGP